MLRSSRRRTKSKRTKPIVLLFVRRLFLDVVSYFEFDPKYGPFCERVRNMYVCVNLVVLLCDLGLAFGRGYENTSLMAFGRRYENTSLMAVSPHSLLIRVGAIDMLVTNRKC